MICDNIWVSEQACGKLFSVRVCVCDMNKTTKFIQFCSNHIKKKIFCGQKQISLGI